MVESSELATALAVGSPDAHNSIPGFLLKLRVLVEDEGIDDIIHWGPGGLTFVITNPVGFAEEILPIYFKHNHLASFIRQLNLYGFHKVTGVSDGGLVKTERECLEFRHPYFMREKPEFLRLIKRKPASHHSKTEEKSDGSVKDIASQVPAIMSIANSVQQVMAKQAETDKKMATLKSENEVLWREVASLHRKNMQQSQMVDKIVRFLVKLVQRPHKGRPTQVSPATPGRPFPLMIDRPSTSGKETNGNKSRTLSDLSGLDTGTRSDNSPSGPVIHDVTELLRSPDGATVLNSEGFKNVAPVSGIAQVVQVMPTYVSVPSPGETHVVHSLAATLGRTPAATPGPSTSDPASMKPDMSMPIGVAPVDGVVGDVDPSILGDVIVLDPSTMSLHPTGAQLSYTLDGKKIIVNPDGTQAIISMDGSETAGNLASFVIPDGHQSNISISVPAQSTNVGVSVPSENPGSSVSYASAGKDMGGRSRGRVPAFVGKKRPASGTGLDEPQQKRQSYDENDLRVAVPSSNPFTFPAFSEPSTSQQAPYSQNPGVDANLSSQFDVDKFLEYLTSSDAHFDVNELYKIVSDPAIVNKVSELDNIAGPPSGKQPLPVTSGSTPHAKQMAGNSSLLDSTPGKVLPDLSELIDDADTHESYYKGLEQSEFQSLDTPLVDGLD